MRIDLHAHASERSGCSIAPEEDLIRAAIGVGLDAMFFTDHHRLVPYNRLTELNEKFAPFRIFTGIEISTVEGEDVLVLGIRDPLLEGLYWHYEELHHFVRKRDGYMAIAHPFRHRNSVHIDLKKCPPDGIEARSINIVSENYPVIANLIEQTGCNQIWNSDAHSSDSVGLFHNCLERTPTDERELIAMLKAGEYSCEKLKEEEFELVNEQGIPIGKARRRECHTNPDLIHPVVHIMVTNSAGRLFLQKRSLHKFIQPGKWDTSVGGHMIIGEEPETAAMREMKEELGVEPRNLQFIYDYLWQSGKETEFVRTFCTKHDGPFELQASEIDDGRFWSIEDIEAELGNGVLTPNFEVEFQTFRKWQATGNNMER